MGSGGAKAGGLPDAMQGLKTGASDNSSFLRMILGPQDNSAAGAMGTKPAFESAMGGTAPTSGSFDLGKVIGQLLGNQMGKADLLTNIGGGVATNFGMLQGGMRTSADQKSGASGAATSILSYLSTLL